MPQQSQALALSLPKDALALFIRKAISASMRAFEDSVLPRYLKLSTFFSVVPCIWISGGRVCVSPGTGWKRTSVFAALIVSPKFSHAFAKLSTQFYMLDST